MELEQVEELEQFTIGFYGDSEILALLKKWAKEEDRSVSAVIRRLIKAEEVRRNGAQPQLIAESIRR